MVRMKQEEVAEPEGPCEGHRKRQRHEHRRTLEQGT